MCHHRARITSTSKLINHTFIHLMIIIIEYNLQCFFFYSSLVTSWNVWWFWTQEWTPQIITQLFANNILVLLEYVGVNVC